MSSASLYDILRGALGIPNFPLANPAANNVSLAEVIRYIQEVQIGQTSDFASAQTILGYLNSNYQHVHSQSKVYPTLAAGVTITGAAAWTLGNFQEIIPANTITTAFDIHYINVEAASATDVYEIVFYKGALVSEIEIGRVRTHKNSVQSGANNVPIQVPPQLANERISAKIASSSGGNDTLTISIYYHEYN